VEEHDLLENGRETSSLPIQNRHITGLSKNISFNLL
jgi:hypothetical protein